MLAKNLNKHRRQTIGLKFVRLIRSMDKRKTCGYSVIACSRTDVLKSLFLKCKRYVKIVSRHNDVISMS